MIRRLAIPAAIILLTVVGAAAFFSMRDGGGNHADPPVVAAPTIPEDLLPRFEVIDDDRVRTQVAGAERECAEIRSQVVRAVVSPRELVRLADNVTRDEVTFGVPDGLILSPEGETAAIQWFFSGPIGPIDEAVGLRLSFGVFRHPEDYPLVDALDLVESTRAPGTPVRSANDVFRAYGFENALLEGSGCAVPLRDPARPTTVKRMHARAALNDDYDGRTRYLHQEALLELTDGRLVQIMLDGLPSRSWAEQVSLFEAIIASLQIEDQR